jgi:hypothetical protein
MHSLPNIVKMIKLRSMKWIGHIGRMGKKRNTYGVLVRKPERKRTLRKTRCPLEHNIKMDLREIESDNMDWIHLVQNRDQCWALVNTVMELRVP